MVTRGHKNNGKVLTSWSTRWKKKKSLVVGCKASIAQMFCILASLLVLLPLALSRKVLSQNENFEAKAISHSRRLDGDDFSDYIGLRIRNDKSLVSFGEKLEIKLFR